MLTSLQIPSRENRFIIINEYLNRSLDLPHITTTSYESLSHELRTTTVLLEEPLLRRNLSRRWTRKRRKRRDSEIPRAGRCTRHSENRTCLAVGRNSCNERAAFRGFGLLHNCAPAVRPAVTLIPLSATILPITVSQGWPRLRVRIAPFNARVETRD